MSKLFGGSFWSGAMFKTSLLHGEEASVPGAGAGYWAGSFWKTAQFRTTMFRGLQVPSEGGRYWSGSFWKTQQFATTFFAGEPVPVVPPVPATSATSSGGGGGSHFVRRIKINKEPVLERGSRNAALAVALLEADELL